MGTFKYKVRVIHFMEDKFTVEYCHYKWKERWWGVYQWLSISHKTPSLNSFIPVLFNVDKAEEFARSINSFEKYTEFMNKENEKKRLWDESQEAWDNKRVPYIVKEIT